METPVTREMRSLIMPYSWSNIHRNPSAATTIGMAQGIRLMARTSGRPRNSLLSSEATSRPTGELQQGGNQHEDDREADAAAHPDILRDAREVADADVLQRGEGRVVVGQAQSEGLDDGVEHGEQAQPDGRQQEQQGRQVGPPLRALARGTGPRAVRCTGAFASVTGEPVAAMEIFLILSWSSG